MGSCDGRAARGAPARGGTSALGGRSSRRDNRRPPPKGTGARDRAGGQEAQSASRLSTVLFPEVGPAMCRAWMVLGGVGALIRATDPSGGLRETSNGGLGLLSQLEPVLSLVH